MIINDKICWKSHLKLIGTKICRSISIIAKARHYVNSKSLHALYCALVSPYINYCIEVWGNTYKSHLESLFILQKRAIRIIANSGYLEHTNQLFIKSHTIKLYDLIELRTVQLMYKARNRLLPEQLQKRFQNRDGGYHLREPLNFKLGNCRTTTKQHCMTYYGVRLWNNLSMEMKQCPTIKQLSNKYKLVIWSRYRQLL